MCPQSGLRKRPGAVRIQNGSAAAVDTGGRQRPVAAAAAWRWDAGWPLLLQLLAVFSVLSLLVCRLQVALPAPGAFERNARGYLRQLVALGPRVGGSPQNEVHAVQILMDQLSNISYGLPAHHNIQVDRQVVSGTFDLDLLDGMASQYANVQNVVAKISPVPESNHSILVNCHFDTVMGSPGASDDAVSCAVMMELLRRIAHGERTLRHNIIFLFNGAEENMLQAAHGFVTQHRWAWSVRAHVNLEACGAGGRELVFQTGPGHPWLVRAFADSAPHPFAHILAQEVFQSGIIPADTDFRIFRDYGKVPGLDMAFYSNGFVYHTRFDNEQQISAGSIQRAGENVQAILYRLATTDDIIDAKRQEVSAVVFFDFLGLFMLCCPDWIYVTVCCITVLVVIITIERSRRRQGLRWSQLGTACGVLVCSWLCSACFVAVIAVLLDSSGLAMSWYSQQSWIHGVFTLPTLSVLILVQQSLCRRYFPALLKDRRRLEALLYETSRLLLLPSLMLSVLLRVYSGFLLLVMLLFPTIVRSVVIETLLRVTTGGWHLGGYVLSQLVPVSMCIYYAVTCLELFMPLTGRVGSAIYPDMAIAMITVFSVVGSSWFVLTSVSLSDRACALGRIMLAISLTSVGLITLTSCGFPYDSARPHPRSHRVMLQHVERRFHDTSGAVVDRDSGLIVINMDRNSPLTLHGHLPGIENSTVLEKLCDQQLYCGVPYYYPVRKVIYRRNFVAGPVPVVYTPVRYSVRRQQLNSTTFKLYLNITGPDHMTMQVCARPGVRLVSWSLGDAGVPHLRSAPFQGRPVYFLYYAWGLHSAPWTLWFQLQVSDSYNSEDYLLDANINGHYLHSEGVQSEYLRNTVSRLPAWMVPTVYTSTLDAVKL